MQQPTCTNIRIRSTQDAHKIFYAVQKGLLHMVTRRLDADERLALRSGCIYAWEERGPHSEITGLGIERFTEGRRWSPSRVRDEFLFYYEQHSESAKPNHPGAPLKHSQRELWDPLVKQTYSVWVETEKGRRKWHLTAYFTQATIDQLKTIDTIHGVRDLVVPDGQFKSTRVSKNRGKTEDRSTRSGDSSTKPLSSVTRTYAPFPSPYQSRQAQPEAASPSEPIHMYQPYLNIQPQSQPSSSPPPMPASAIPHYGTYQSIQDPYPPSELSRHAYAEVTHTNVSPAAPQPVIDIQRPSYQSSDHGTSKAHAIYRSGRSSPDGSTHDTSPVQWSNSSAQYAQNAPPYVNPPHPLPSVSHSLPFYTYNDTIPDDLILPAIQDPEQLQLSYSSSNYGSDSPNSSSGRSQSKMSDVRLCAPSLSSLNIIIPEPLFSEYELVMTPTDDFASPGQRGGIGPCRNLAPLNIIARSHPYRREPEDDRTLRLLHPRSP